MKKLARGRVGWTRAGLGFLSFAFAAGVAGTLVAASGRRPAEVATGEVVRDADRNEYRTIRVGKQRWLVGNLRTTRLNDGTAIPEVKDGAKWADQLSPALCWYGNSAPAHRDGVGALYNWYAVNTGKLCPKGWRVPGDADWQALIAALGGKTVAGGKLKSTATAAAGGPNIDESELDVEKPADAPDAVAAKTPVAKPVPKTPATWNRPNAAATNDTGFSALPGGARSDADGAFDGKGTSGFWWSATETSPVIARRYMMSYDNGHVVRMTVGKSDGLSVCCMSDDESK